MGREWKRGRSRERAYLLWVVFGQHSVSMELLQHVLQLLGRVWAKRNTRDALAPPPVCCVGLFTFQSSSFLSPVSDRIKHSFTVVYSASSAARELNSKCILLCQWFSSSSLLNIYRTVGMRKPPVTAATNYTLSTIKPTGGHVCHKTHTDGEFSFKDKNSKQPYALYKYLVSTVQRAG